MSVLTKKHKLKKCRVCDTEFETQNTTQKYCRLDCAKSARQVQQKECTERASDRNKEKFTKVYGKKVGKLSLKCKQCKQTYSVYQSSVKWRGSSFCSKACKFSWRKKSRTRGRIVRELDTVFSRYIREKYAKNGFVACASCGKTDEVKNLQNGHYISRSHYATRWLEKNCHPQCYRCNIALHGNYALYTQYMVKTYGANVIDELVTLSNTIVKYSKPDLQAMIEQYKKILTNLNTS